MSESAQYQAKPNMRVNLEVMHALVNFNSAKQMARAYATNALVRAALAWHRCHRDDSTTNLTQDLDATIALNKACDAYTQVVPVAGQQKPSIGRIVVFKHHGSADGKFQPVESPAVVQRVNEDGTVELFVMSTYGGLFFNHNVQFGDAPGQWSWPARV